MSLYIYAYTSAYLKWTFQTPNSNVQNQISHNDPKYYMVNVRCSDADQIGHAHNIPTPIPPYMKLCSLPPHKRHYPYTYIGFPHAPFPSLLAHTDGAACVSCSRAPFRIRNDVWWWKSSIRTRITFMHNQIWMANDTWWLCEIRGAAHRLASG